MQRFDAKDPGQGASLFWVPFSTPDGGDGTTNREGPIGIKQLCPGENARLRVGVARAFEDPQRFWLGRF